MKAGSITKALLGAALLGAVGLELGMRPFDPRSVVEDGVVGPGLWIIEVDGRPVARVRHGWLITRVPLALVRPGDRVMTLSATPHPAEGTELVELRATIERGVTYRIENTGTGAPRLVARD